MSLYKQAQIMRRRDWAFARNPKLDRKTGPAELVPGLTWRSVWKFNAVLIGMAYIIGHANKKAYDKTNESKRGTTVQHTQETKRLLREEDQTDLSKSEFRQQEQQSKQNIINMKGQGKMEYEMKKIPRPDEGLTIDNLRETSMGWKPSNKSSGVLGDMLDKIRGS